jgi:hypothetical protein
MEGGAVLSCVCSSYSSDNTASLLLAGCGANKHDHAKANGFSGQRHHAPQTHTPHHTECALSATSPPRGVRTLGPFRAPP